MLERPSACVLAALGSNPRNASSRISHRTLQLQLLMCPGNNEQPKVLLPVFCQRKPGNMPEKLFQRIRKIIIIARKIFLNRGMDELRRIEE